MNRPRYPGLGMAWPAPRRPAPGGGLAVLVVVTVLAALAAPHAKAVRGLVAGGLPTITAPTRPAPPPASRPPAGLSFTNAAGCRPAGDYAPRAWTVGSGRCWSLRPAATGFGCRACAAAIPGTSRAPAGSPTTAVWRAVDVDQVDGRPVSPLEHRGPAAGGLDRPGPGRGPAERGRLPLAFGGRPWFTDAGHQGHLHVGFPGPTRPVVAGDRRWAWPGRWGCAAPSSWPVCWSWS